MGCLKNVTRAVFFTVAIVGFMALGGKEWITNSIHDFFNPDKETLYKRAQKVGDFRNINKEFEIEKAAGILGYNAVLAEHKATGQKMLVVNSGSKPILTQEDITSADAEKRIKAAIRSVKYQSSALEEFYITERGTMQSYGKEVPYVKFNAKIRKFPIGEISGVISVVKDEKGDEKILLSANEKDRYSQLITNEFFKGIK